MWRWFPPTFGNSLPNTNPGGGGTFNYDLRYPGQIYDGQSGLHQNYFRDFDPAVGRYVESDPIGLKAGINTYGYVGARPTMRTDPLGLAPSDYFECLIQQSMTHSSLNCGDVLMRQAADALWRGACTGVKCTSTCALTNFVGKDFDEALVNAYKEMAIKVLEHIAETTASKYAKYGLPLVGEVDFAHDAIGTIRCVTNCVKN
jgi:RHS repeat-associated protein